MLVLVFQAWPRAHELMEPAAVAVSLVPPPPPVAPEPAKQPAPVRASAPRAAERPAPRPPSPRRPAAFRKEIRPAPAPETLPAAPVQAVELSDSQLAGAITAGSGAGGGGDGSGGGGGPACDMVRRLQNALRRDWRVRAAVDEVRRTPGDRGGAIVLWDGDWVQSNGQEGKGLASVRQAISIEVAFAPEACRTEPVHGLVLLSLNDGPRPARVVLGSRAWRWSDLLFAR